MPKAHLITRIGSKQNDIKFFRDYLPLDIDTVIEPFGGGFTVIRDVYKDDKYNKFVNDLDPILYNCYINPNKLIDGFKIWNECLEMPHKTREETKKMLDNFKNSDVSDEMKKYIIFGCSCGIIYNSKNINDSINDLQLISKIKFSNIDWLEFMTPFLNNDKCFIFLDPPYLFSNNSMYIPQEDGNDMTDILCLILDIFKNPDTKARITLIINDLKIISYMFKPYIKGSYGKIYGISKKKARHLIIANF